MAVDIPIIIGVERVAKSLEDRVCDVRLRILDLAFRSGKGHIGSALSVADLVVCVLANMESLGTSDNERDRFVLSKGHSAMALYAGLENFGVLSPEDLARYQQNGTLLATHPLVDVQGIDFSTGSLGQGICFAVGSAMAAKIQASKRTIYCLLSDSELDEGSTWESALIAAHNELDNLVVILDFNSQQALGTTQEILNLSGVAGAWEKLGWEVIEVNGHDTKQISQVLNRESKLKGPKLIVSHTNAGNGVSFMQNSVAWHYLPMTEDQYSLARDEISGSSGNA